MSNFHFDPKEHCYTLDGKPLMGVTSVLSVIAKNLTGWAARMTADWVRENCKKNDLEAYIVHESDLLEASKAHTKKKDKAAEKGKDVHAVCEEYVNWCIKENEGKAQPWSTTVKDPMVGKFINWAVENKIVFLASEKMVYSREWWVAGTCDLVFKMGDRVIVGDIKTHKRLWDRVPFAQTAAYAKMLVEREEFKEIHGTCIITTPKDDGEFTVHWSYDLEGDIKLFEAALRLYKGIRLAE